MEWLITSLYFTHRVIILNRGSMFAFQWREFSPPLSSSHRQKRDRRRCNSRGTQNTYFPLSPLSSPQLGPLANERAVSGQGNLHHFLPVSLRGMLPLFNIMTLWFYYMLWLISSVAMILRICLNLYLFVRSSSKGLPVIHGKLIDFW